jgi:hypothetical protein
MELINGNWMQTIAVMLNDYIQSTSGNTCCSSASTEVVVTQNINLPQEVITIFQNHNLPTPPQTIVRFDKNYIKPAPKVITITNKNVKDRFCGMPSSNSKYVECSNCVDKHIQQHPNANINDMQYCNASFKKEDKRCIGGQMIMGRCYCK